MSGCGSALDDVTHWTVYPVRHWNYSESLWFFTYCDIDVIVKQCQSRSIHTNIATAVSTLWLRCQDVCWCLPSASGFKRSGEANSGEDGAARSSHQASEPAKPGGSARYERLPASFAVPVPKVEVGAEVVPRRAEGRFQAGVAVVGCFSPSTGNLPLVSVGCWCLEHGNN